ncbi:BspA family leucine-rich repeat surface protein [Companilactobacillus sp. HBUAS56257]|uniref:BspA family leucine-rich repeat surface protein n=1 Tax=Companilactobacillus sp. HBUAS56257 TaxID=3109360 RepID=UPI002FF18861
MFFLRGFNKKRIKPLFRIFFGVQFFGLLLGGRGVVKADSTTSLDAFVQSNIVENNSLSTLSIASGTFGTCDWDIDSNGQLTIYAGELGVGIGNWKDFSKSITSVVVEPGVKANQNSNNLFYDLTQATTIDVTNLDTSEVTDFSNMFAFSTINTSKLQEIIGIENLDTSAATNLSNMFFKATNLAGNLDVSNFKTENVTNMSGMFYNVPANIVGLKNFNTSQVNDLDSMFSYSSLVTTADIADWDVSKVTDFSNLFYSSKTLSDVDLSKWNPENATDISYLFRYCTKISSLKGLENWDISNVKNMSFTFGNMNLSEFPEIVNWDTSNVTDMSGTFSGLSNVTSLDLSKWNTSNVTTMSNMFQNDGNLNEVVGLSDFNTEKVQITEQMFLGCAFDNLDLSNWNTSSLKRTAGMFSGCTKLETLLENFDTSKVNNMDRMFYNTKLLDFKITNLSNWDTSSVTSMSQMFFQNTFTDIDFVKNWNVSAVENFSSMFASCSKLVSCDLSGWKTSSAKNLSKMFLGNSNLVDADIWDFDTSNVTNVSEMLKGVSKITSYDLSNWDMRKVTNTDSFSSGSPNIWKIALGSNSFITEDMNFPEADAGLAIPGSGGNISISDRWQNVDFSKGGTDFNPLGNLLLTTSDLIADYSTPGHEAQTFVRQQQPYESLTLEVPDVDFGFVTPFSGVISRKDTMQIKIENNSYPLKTYHAYLTLQMATPFTNDEGSVLNDAIIFRNEYNQDTKISNEPNVVSIGDFPTGESTLEWDKNKGLLLNMHGQAVQRGTYSTSLKWSLVDSL